MTSSPYYFEADDALYETLQILFKMLCFIPLLNGALVCSLLALDVTCAHRVLANQLQIFLDNSSDEGPFILASGQGMGQRRHC